MARAGLRASCLSSAMLSSIDRRPCSVSPATSSATPRLPSASARSRVDPSRRVLATTSRSKLTARAWSPWSGLDGGQSHERATLKLLVAGATVRVRGFLVQPSAPRRKRHEPSRSSRARAASSPLRAGRRVPGRERVPRTQGCRRPRDRSAGLRARRRRAVPTRARVQVRAGLGTSAAASRSRPSRKSPRRIQDGISLRPSSSASSGSISSARSNATRRFSRSSSSRSRSSFPSSVSSKQSSARAA